MGRRLRLRSNGSVASVAMVWAVVPGVQGGEYLRSRTGCWGSRTASRIGEIGLMTKQAMARALWRRAGAGAFQKPVLGPGGWESASPMRPSPWWARACMVVAIEAVSLKG